MLRRIPKPLRNFYVVSALIFLAWMIALDSNNLIARYQLTSKLNALEDEKEYYLEKMQEVEKDQKELFGDRQSLEKFAREKYLMKKKTEDIYVIVEE